MQIYLPIAEMSVNIFAVLLLGGLTGMLSGMFGIGGGFLTTPLLMFIGVPPPVAVATSANQIVAASLTGFMAHWRKSNVDFRMGILLLVGGLVGSAIGVWAFHRLKYLGYIDLVISISYVLFLGGIGLMMAIESVRAILRKSRKEEMPQTAPLRDAGWMQKLPLKMQFPRSQITISALLPLGIGFSVGILVSLMGVGGGFFMIPAMIYLLGMPTSVVVGTSLFQIIFITANVTFLQAVTTQTVDIVLALLLLTGSVIGVQAGLKIGAKLSAEKLRGLLASMVLLVALKLAFDLVVTPDDIYSVTVMAAK